MVACSCATGSAAGAPLGGAGRLLVPPGAQLFGLGQVAVSGGVAVVGSSGAAQDAVYVFERPPGGRWSTETSSAQLIAADGNPHDQIGAYDGSVAISGGAVVATARDSAGFAQQVFVFTKPAGGWSGTSNQSATLTASARSGCLALGDVAISGPTIAISCRLGTQAGAPGAILVFREPKQGWTGTLHETAKLLPTRRRDRIWAGAPVAIAGPAIVTDGYSRSQPRGYAYVFQSPRRGWHGVVHQAATLSTPAGAYFNPVAISGHNVFAATNAAFVDRRGRASIYEFSEPTTGWRGMLHQTAQLKYKSAADPVDVSLAASGRRVTVSFDLLGTEHQCPCSGTVAGFIAPKHGWSGLVSASASTTVSSSSGATPLAMQGQTIFASGATDVQLLRISSATKPPAPG